MLKADRRRSRGASGSAGALPSHLNGYVLDWTQFWAPALDDRTWNYLSHYSLLEMLWQTGVRLQKAGLVNRLEDVQLFSPEELECIGKADQDGKDICEYRELLDKRKRELERYGRLTPPEFIGAYVKPPPRMEVARQVPDAEETKAAERGTVLKGQGFTQGRVTGIAQKAENLKDPALLDSLSEENILVCVEGSFDNHTDWLSLFMIVRGLVTVEGCADNHSVQIARECGVTFINLPKSGPASIPDNTRIALDGKAGTVTILGV